MHGLIFETSVWLLAESTRLLLLIAGRNHVTNQPRPTLHAISNSLNIRLHGVSRSQAKLLVGNQLVLSNSSCKGTLHARVWTNFIDLQMPLWPKSQYCYTKTLPSHSHQKTSSARRGWLRAVAPKVSSCYNSKLRGFKIAALLDDSIRCYCFA